MLAQLQNPPPGDRYWSNAIVLRVKHAGKQVQRFSVDNSRSCQYFANHGCNCSPLKPSRHYYTTFFRIPVPGFLRRKIHWPLKRACGPERQLRNTAKIPPNLHHNFFWQHQFMNRPINRRGALAAFAASFASLTVATRSALASKSAVKMKNWQGTIDFVPNGPSPFTMQGTASHLGNFSAIGEVTLVPVDESGLMLGAGSVVFTSANGDLLVGATEWIVNGEEISEIHFRWRDSVEFSDETVVANTGRFVSDRPPGLVVIAIIAILIGLLLPAVQKNPTPV